MQFLEEYLKIFAHTHHPTETELDVCARHITKIKL